jgi:hypothetical protein
MRPEHRIARDHHCRLAGETMHPRFAVRNGSWSRVLTVNSGYE